MMSGIRASLHLARGGVWEREQQELVCFKAGQGAGLGCSPALCSSVVFKSYLAPGAARGLRAALPSPAPCLCAARGRGGSEGLSSSQAWALWGWGSAWAPWGPSTGGDVDRRGFSLCSSFWKKISALRCPAGQSSQSTPDHGHTQEQCSVACSAHAARQQVTGS